MILNIIFKALFIYFLFMVVRTVFRAYKILGNANNQMGGQRGGAESSQGPFTQTTGRKKSDEDAIEAEYRVIKD